MIFYTFPHFTCIPRVLQKVCHDKTEGILLVPEWPNQLWYTQYTEVIIKKVTLPSRSDLLALPSQTNIKHPVDTLLFREAVVATDQSENVNSFFLASWAPKTQQNFNTYINTWIQYCGKMNLKKNHSKHHLQMVWRFYLNCSTRKLLGYSSC